MAIYKAWKETPYYHFTSLESFLKINEAGKLKLSKCNGAKNAAVETMALYSAIKNIINRNSELKNNLLTDYSCMQDDSLIESIIKCREQSYMACFSMIPEMEHCI